MIWSTFGRRWAALPYAIFDRNPLVQSGGIQFPATQVPSADANTLDDYEEGTWTPLLSFGGGSTGLTYTTQAGTYTKIGRLVSIGARIVLSAKGSSTGAAQVAGLPFSAGSVGHLHPVTIGSYAAMSGLTGAPMGRIFLGNIVMGQSGAAASADLTDTSFTNTTTIDFSSVYLV